MSLPLHLVLGDVPLPPLAGKPGDLIPSMANDAHQLFSEKQPEDRMGLPRLYLDVDGVLVEHYGNPRALQLRAGAGSFLRFAADRFEVIWCTSWFDQANLLIPALDGFPRVGFGFKTLFWTDSKANAILAREGSNRFWVWVDDEDRPHDRATLKGAHVLGNFVLVGPSKPLASISWKLKRWLISSS